jgi:hypothetical protein
LQSETTKGNRRPTKHNHQDLRIVAVLVLKAFLIHDLALALFQPHRLSDGVEVLHGFLSDLYDSRRGKTTTCSHAVSSEKVGQGAALVRKEGCLTARNLRDLSSIPRIVILRD